MKKGRTRPPAVPRLAGENGNSELDRVNQDHSSPPSVHAREFHGRPKPFRENATGGDSKDNQHVHGSIIFLFPGSR